MSETLLLVQPRFSQLGHFSHYTLLNARALSPYIALEALVYVSGNNFVQQSLLDQLVQVASTTVVKGQPAGWGNGTWVLYHRLAALVRARPEIKHIIFFDPQMMTLAAAMLLRPLPKQCQVIAPYVYGPEHHAQGSGITITLKQGLFRLATYYRTLRLAPFTAELAMSWRQSGLVAPDACLELPMLQLTDAGLPASKSPISQRANLVFTIVGQLRRPKNIDRILPLFREGLVSGRLHVAGPVVEDIDSLATGTCSQVALNLNFLSEPELNHVVAAGHYSLLLYVDLDERMESGMLFTSARLGCPIIGSKTGWLGRMIRDYDLGYTIDPYDTEQIRTCLANCALPGSSEYRRFEAGIRRLLADYRREVVVPRFLMELGIHNTEASRG